MGWIEYLLIVAGSSLEIFVDDGMSGIPDPESK